MMMLELDNTDIDETKGELVFLNCTGITDDTFQPLHFKNARYLYLKRNSLTNLPPDINMLKQLRHLHIDNNAIDWLPDEIGELPYLTVLNINGNHLTKLPAAIGRLQELLKLQVSSNLLTSLPKELGNLRKLQTLEASRNNLVALPAELGNCSELKVLSLDKNRLKVFPRQLCLLRKLTELSLCGNQLEYLPPVIFQELVSLQDLVMDNNRGFQAFPIIDTMRNTNCNLLCNSCGQPDQKLSNYFRYITVHGKQFAIPVELEQICVPGIDSVPLLSELCLRAVYRLLDAKGGCTHLGLPAHLVDLLQFPTAICQCQTRIFKAAFPMVYKRTLLPSPLFFIDFRCSLNCDADIPQADLYETQTWKLHAC